MSDKVVHIGDFTFKRKNTHWLGSADPKSCKHRVVIIDDNGGTVTCERCEAHLSPIWALTMLTNEWQGSVARLASWRDEIKAESEKHIHLIAARKVEKAWRSRDMVPTCPHCRRGISPTDGFGGSRINKKIDERHRAIAAAKPRPTP